MQNILLSTKEQDATRFAMRNAHQLGVIARLSREIICCNTLDNIEEVISGAAEKFNVSGCFRASVSGQQISIQFGEGINRNHCVGLACFTNCDRKLSTTDDFIVFKTQYLLLILLREDSTDEEADALKDNLAILVDTIHYWLDHYQRLQQKDEKATTEKLTLADKMNDIVVTMLRFSQHLNDTHNQLCQDLLSNLLVKLPTLGLEADQEESMIELVSGANDKHGTLIDMQIQHNEHMQSIMAEAVNLLVNYQADQTYNSISSDYNADITLF